MRRKPPKGKGGRRPGSGRKPSPKTLLARLAIAELDEEAERSIMFLVGVRDNPKVAWGIRVVAAQDLIDRRFGKAKQAMTVSGGDSPVQIQYVPATNNPSPDNKGL
jgi:hypothetical protein